LLNVTRFFIPATISFILLISEQLKAITMKRLFHIPSILLLFITSCKPSIKTDELYGKWKYIKVEHLTGDPADTLSGMMLASESPSIVFSKNNGYVINWGGKELSHGTFTLDGMNIRIKEIMPDGSTREFPFYVSEFTDTKIVFDTKGDDGSKVTAVKE